jgi:hypothetical protein
MTGTDWSFSLRSATGFSGDAESDDNEENVGDARTSLHLSSNSRALQQIDLAAREDSAQYRSNPWSIAKVNAATRPRQPNATVKPVSERPVTKKPPQGTIVDAFKRRAQKPNTTTKSSAQANWRRTPLQKPAPISAIDASDDPVSASALPPASVAHTTTSAVDHVPIPSRSRTPRQYQETPLPSFLPNNAFLAPHSSQKTNRTQNLQFTPKPKRVQPSSTPVRPHPQHPTLNISGPPSKPPAPFGPHIIKAPTPSEAQTFIGNVTPTTSAYREDGRAVHPSQSDLHSTPVELGSKVASPHPLQNIRSSPRPRSGQPIIEDHSKFEIMSPSSSFAQARRFFEYRPPLVPAIKQPSPKSDPPAEEPPPSPPPSRPVIASPPRERIDPYDQLMSSPDSKWSTLRPPKRKNATSSGKGRSKPRDVKGGKFRLPLTMTSITPSKEPPQKKPRVVTYLPPPPPKKQKTASERPLTTEGVGTSTGRDGMPRFSQPHVPGLSPSSVSKPEDPDGRVTLSTTLGRDGPTELAHTFRPIRFERRVHPLQTRPREDPSGTLVSNKCNRSLVVPFDLSRVPIHISSGRRSMFSFGISSGWRAVVSHTEIQNTHPAVLMRGMERLLSSPGTRAGQIEPVACMYVSQLRK